MDKRILFVEDDNLLGKMYKTALEDHGYKVDLQPDSEKAQKQLDAQYKYDLILLDLILPGMSGINFLRAIKDTNSPYKAIPVYILTNVDGSDMIAEGISLGAEGYFLKISTPPKQMIEAIDHFFTSK